MVFSSSIFLFLYFPLAVVLHFILPRSYRNSFLLLSSLIFYVWGEVALCWVVVATVGLNYFLALWLDASAQKKNILTFGVCVNLILLGWFKYANFLVGNFNTVFLHFSTSPIISLAPIHLPLGISFFTFHAISYLIDVKRGNVVAQRNFVDFALYILLFPQLIAGPIIRYKNIANQIMVRNISSQDFAIGFQRFVYGLGKKMLMANPLGETADKIFVIAPSDLSGPVSWLGVLTYTFQIYYDFSGYSDMAIGLMRVLGFRIDENFNYPYISCSVKEFWKRWHISLSMWFRDYVYIPLGGNRHGILRSYTNLVIIFILCGFWHGASWTFLVWGLWHGVFLVLERTPFGAMIGRCPRPIQHVYLLLVVIIGWVFFRSGTLGYAIEYLRAMMGLGHANPWLYPLPLYLDMYTSAAIMMAAIGATPWWVCVWARYGEEIKATTVAVVVWSSAQTISMALILFLSACFVAAGTYNPFIYFRF